MGPDTKRTGSRDLCETRTLTKAGYARFRNFLLYGEHGLTGKKTLINIFQDLLTLEYGDAPLSRYSVGWQPDDEHFLRVGKPVCMTTPTKVLSKSSGKQGRWSDMSFFVPILQFDEADKEGGCL